MFLVLRVLCCWLIVSGCFVLWVSHVDVDVGGVVGERNVVGGVKDRVL